MIGNNVEGVLALKKPWPSIGRTVYQDHKRYLETYMKVKYMSSAVLSHSLLIYIYSHTLVCSIREMELRVMSMDIFGLKDVLTVRFSYHAFFS